MRSLTISNLFHYCGLLSTALSLSTQMKFGLNVRKKAQPRPMFSRRNQLGQDDDDDEQEDEQQQQNQQNAKKQHRAIVNQQLGQSTKVTKKVAEQHAKALEEDANIFDYDAVYDDLKEAERLKREAQKGVDTKKVIQEHPYHYYCVDLSDMCHYSQNTSRHFWKQPRHAKRID